MCLDAAAQSDSGRSAFLEWSRGALHPVATLRAGAPFTDLSHLRKALAGADVVALSEGDHGIAEPLEFRNRLFRFLVEELGFTAIAIESGVTESRVVHDYVLGGPGELPNVLSQGFSWTFDRFGQNATLVKWMREYNLDPRTTRKISFFGFDVPGSPGNPQAARGLRTATDDALAYLEKVDPAAAAALHARVDRWLPFVRVDRRNVPGPRYRDLAAADRDALTAAIADLVTLFEHRQAKYAGTSSEAEYQWAYRSALGARAADAWLRKAESGAPAAAAFREAMEVRDRMQAENVRWIVEQQSPAGKVLVFGAWIHLATTPIPYWVGLPDRTDTAVAGTYLRRFFGDRLVTIGHVFRRGRWYCENTLSRDDAVAGSLAQLFGVLNQPQFLLDLRTAPGSVQKWLDQDHVVSDTYPWGQYQLNLRRGFDLLFYTDTVTPACPG